MGATMKATNSVPENALALGLRDVAAMTGLSRSTVWRFIKAGEIRTIKVGHRRLIMMTELHRWLRQKQGEETQTEK